MRILKQRLGKIFSGALTGSTGAWGGSINALAFNIVIVIVIIVVIIMIFTSYLRCESVGDDAPEPEESDIVSVHRANLGHLIMMVIVMMMMMIRRRITQ